VISYSAAACAHSAAVVPPARNSDGMVVLVFSSGHFLCLQPTLLSSLQTREGSESSQLTGQSWGQCL
jgi:hypothetical protein